MNNHSHTNQDIENINERIALESSSNDDLELFKRALSEALDSKICEIEEEIKDVELPPPSKRYKIRMNRLFRERACGAFLPFPESDNLYERFRSRLIVKFKINEFIDRLKEDSREK